MASIAAVAAASMPRTRPARPGDGQGEEPRSAVEVEDAVALAEVEAVEHGFGQDLGCLRVDLPEDPGGHGELLAEDVGDQRRCLEGFGLVVTLVVGVDLLDRLAVLGPFVLVEDGVGHRWAAVEGHHLDVGAGRPLLVSEIEGADGVHSERAAVDAHDVVAPVPAHPETAELVDAETDPGPVPEARLRHRLDHHGVVDLRHPPELLGEQLGLEVTLERGIDVLVVAAAAATGSGGGARRADALGGSLEDLDGLRARPAGVLLGDLGDHALAGQAMADEQHPAPGIAGHEPAACRRSSQHHLNRRHGGRFAHLGIRVITTPLGPSAGALPRVYPPRQWVGSIWCWRCSWSWRRSAASSSGR